MVCQSVDKGKLAADFAAAMCECMNILGACAAPLVLSGWRNVSPQEEIQRSIVQAVTAFLTILEKNPTILEKNNMPRQLATVLRQIVMVTKRDLNRMLKSAI